MNLDSRFQELVLQHAGGVIRRLTESQTVNGLVNAGLIDHVVSSTAGRPLPYSLWTGRPVGTPYAGAGPEEPSDYVTWTGLTDRRFTGRHLAPAPAEYVAGLPPVAEVAALYRRTAFVPSTTTSTLLAFFAQWFTDSVLRTAPDDTRLNTSNHEIDLCQVYGLSAETTALLRTGVGGTLRTGPDGLFPARLFDVHGAIAPQFATLPYMVARPDGKPLEDVVLGTLDVPADERAARRQRLYATGLERGNSTIVYAAVSTVFLREHNRLCGLLAAAHPAWDDDRLFQTARNTNIVLLLVLVVNEYINHLAQAPFAFSLRAGLGEDRRWYRANRIALEFDLLYRWHSLVPDALEVDGTRYDQAEYRFNNAVLERHGVEAVIAAASRQPAGRVGLRNNPDFLWNAEVAAHTLSRKHRLQPFVRYQECFGETPVRSFGELAGDTDMARRLDDLYGGDIEAVEFLVGLFAQAHADGAVLPETLNAMVAVDAFSQIFTNPLLATGVYGTQAFGAEGLAVIGSTTSFAQVVARNRAPGVAEADVFASFALHGR